MVIEVLIAAVLIMVASLGGVLFVHQYARQFLEERLSYLVAFSAGVFLVTAGALTLEVFSLFSGSLIFAIGTILGGYALAWVLELLLPETHHHHDPACGHAHNGARKLLAGDAIHNVADGIMLVPAFLASPALGIAVSASIFIHELLQEISEFFVLKQAGYSTKQALSLNFAVSSTILIGVGLSYLALATHDLEGVLLGLSAGFFLHIVFHDLFPRRHEHETPAEFVEHLVLLGIGLIAMASINVLLGDNHVHGEDVHGGDHDHAAEVGDGVDHDSHDPAEATHGETSDHDHDHHEEEPHQ